MSKRSCLKSFGLISVHSLRCGLQRKLPVRLPQERKTGHLSPARRRREEAFCWARRARAVRLRNLRPQGMQNGRKHGEADGRWSHLAGQEAYVKLSVAGEGSFGTVWFGVHSATGERVALKLLPRGEKCDRSVKRELRSVVKLCHPHIVRCRHLFLTDTDLCIVFDYCSAGNLQQYVSQRGALPESEARCFFQQLMLAVSYMHRMGVVNRDIKLENAMLDGDTRLLRLTDFGYAKTDVDSQPISKVGTPNYAAPEVIQPDEREYEGEQADAWSCGVFLYVMLFCKYPFERPDDPHDQHGVARVLQRTIACDYNIPSAPAISPECRDLIQRLFVNDPYQRYRVADIMRHPFFLKDLPPGTENLNAYCLQRQMSAVEMQWKDEWVNSLWGQAREQVVRRPSAHMPQPSTSGWSMPGFDQAFLQEASASLSTGNSRLWSMQQ